MKRYRVVTELWINIPAWATHSAIDKNGAEHVYDAAPTLKDYDWIPSGQVQFIFQHQPIQDWRESLKQIN
ncbi:hypothetical protein LJ739_06800 [Aestuariibacter halophilus]|uniref:Uncharacterized protein n=1 Tax=Fluctibacter halophilus TaxID=226011 RepID=A0ABS8G805_9ALTE|nr:hypothetical protein [Aestuariibacter halophilus]